MNDESERARSPRLLGSPEIVVALMLAPMMGSGILVREAMFAGGNP